MRCCVKATDLIIVAIYAYLIADIILNWNDYTSCDSPIQAFLLSTYLFILLYLCLFIFKATCEVPTMTRKAISLLIYSFIHPVFIFLTIQGVIWQDRNQRFTPSCIPPERIPGLIWCWIGILFIIDAIYIFIMVSKMIRWWKAKLLQRRIRRLVHELLRMDDQQLREFLLITSGEENDQLARTGLTQDDINRINTLAYDHSLVDIVRGNLDLCPICCEEFQIGSQIKSLPICAHIFHEKCIREWLLTNPLCPMCRANVRFNLASTRLESNTYHNSINNTSVGDLESNIPV